MASLVCVHAWCTNGDCTLANAKHISAYTTENGCSDANANERANEINLNGSWAGGRVGVLIEKSYNSECVDTQDGVGKWQQTCKTGLDARFLSREVKQTYWDLPSLSQRAKHF